MAPEKKEEQGDADRLLVLDAEEAETWFAELFKMHPVADRECTKCGCVNNGTNRRCWNCLASL